MAISFRSLNYSAHAWGCMNKHRSHYATRINPALAIPPLSILLHTDESGNLLDSKKSLGSNTIPTSSDFDGYVLRQDNTVGIIGGVLVNVSRERFLLLEAKLRPLEAGSPLQIAVFATEATLMAGFYQQKLQNEGFEVVMPDKATMEHTVIPAIEALKRKGMEGARNLLRITLQVLLVRAVNTIILTSDEMRELLPLDDHLLKKSVDPMDSLVRSTIKWDQSSGKGT